MLNTFRYRENAYQRSKIMRDRFPKPLDTAVYWVEYVIRHQGATHLRYPGADLAWYQRLLLDIYAFVLLIVLSVVSVLYLMIKNFFRHKLNLHKKKTKSS